MTLALASNTVTRDIIAATDVTNLGDLLVGTAGYGQLVRLHRQSDSTNYANIFGNVDTNNGRAVRIQYGNPDGVPVVLADFAKAGVALNVGVNLKQITGADPGATYTQLYAKSDSLLYYFPTGGSETRLAKYTETPTSVLTTTGDILYASAANTPARLGIGATNFVLGVVGGIPAWIASPTSVLTATGDILYASAANTLAKLAAGSNGQVLTLAAGIPSWQPSETANAGSLIINGNFDHFERVAGSGTQTSTTTYNVITSYAADRFFVVPAGASVTQQPSITVPDSKSQRSLLITGAASVTTVDIGQRIRAAIVGQRGMQSLVFSCYVRNTSGSSYTPTLRIGTPAAADDFTTVTNRLDQTLQSCADSAWTRVTHVFDPSAYTNIANGMEVVLRIPNGSSVSGDTNRIAQFELRPGSAFVSYIAPDPDLALVQCQRYMRVYGGEATNEVAGTGQAASTTSTRIDVLWDVPMRIAPTCSVSANSDWALTSSAGSLITCTSTSFAIQTTRSFAIVADVAAGLTAGDNTRFLANTTTNARLYASAEL